jgi:hypothetical protein
MDVGHTEVLPREARTEYLAPCLGYNQSTLVDDQLELDNAVFFPVHFQ